MRQELISIRGMATGARRRGRRWAGPDGGLAIADWEGDLRHDLTYPLLRFLPPMAQGLGTLSGVAWTVLV
jgi:hypothetical protein